MRTLTKDHLDAIMQYTINRFGYNTNWYNYLMKAIIQNGNENGPLVNELDYFVELAYERAEGEK